MSRRSCPLLIAGIAALSALLLPAGREACAQQVGTLTNTGGLNFGQFVVGNGGTVTVSPGGVRTTPPGGVILLSSSTVSAATFSVAVTGKSTGKPWKTVSFTLPADGTVKLTSTKGSMAVDKFVSSPDTTSVAAPISTTAVSVGATLTVVATQPSGTYSGSFTVIANFQ
jgi:hypothetical protein